MDSRNLGFFVIIGGVLLIVVGALIFSGALGWFGRLPGDVRVERGSTRFYFPVSSMIVLSIVLSLLLTVLRRYL